TAASSEVAPPAPVEGPSPKSGSGPATPKKIVDAPDISLFEEPSAKANRATKPPPASWPPADDSGAYRAGRAKVKNLLVDRGELPEHIPLPRPTVYGGPASGDGEPAA